MQENEQEPGEIQARLVVTAEEDGTQRELPLGLPTQPGTALIIGRSRSADLVIQDPYVSGRHLSIRFEAGTHVVKDLGSTHGSTVNDNKLIGEQPLEPGDRLGFGHCSAVYHRTQRKLVSAAELLKPKPKPEPEPEQEPASKPEPTPDPSAAPEQVSAQEQPTPEKSADHNKPQSPAQTDTPAAAKPAPTKRSSGILKMVLGLLVVLLVLGVLAVLGLQVFLGIDLVSDLLSPEPPS